MSRLGQLVTAVLWMAAITAHAAPRQQPAGPPDPQTVPRITLEAFRPLQAASKVLVVDVRDGLAFAGGHIPGALNVPLPEVERRVDEIRRQAASRPIVLYCSCPSEHSSAEAGLILQAHHVSDVRALVGGYIDWVKTGGAVER
jgi:rhodanese-related sulfurtransferase